MAKFIIACGVLAVVCGVAAAEKVTVHRDEWGVPHIFTDTPAGAAYGLGWAQAEDRLDQLLTNFRLAAGTMSEAFGPDHIDHDYQQRLVGHERVCRELYPELPAELRAMSEAFIAGIADYMAANPDQVPDWAPELEPWMPAAFGRLIIFGWPLGTAMDELRRRDQVELGEIGGHSRSAIVSPDFTFASNEWAVRPERTKEGSAIMLIDPHIPWDGPFRFYEFRAHAGDFQVSGFAPLGAPLVGLGHNAHLAWACTTGGPDTTDIYIEEINPENPLQYRYDGEWRDITVERVEIKVNGAEPVVREIESTHHGPILLREGDRAYAMACPYLDQIGLMEQLYRMNMATNLDEFRQALAMCQFMEQNTMMADVTGNIFYCRTGRVPRRPEGYDFSKPVPGNTSKSEWLGLHPMSELVQLLNPRKGYMQNCNISPDTMLRDCPIRAEDYPSYIFNARPGGDNSRGRRAVELLDAEGDMSVDEAIGIALDTHADGAEEWQQAIRDAADALRDYARIHRLRPALALIGAWDGYMDADSEGATLYRALREAVKEHGPAVDTEAIRLGQELSSEQQEALLESLGEAAAYVKETFGKLRVPWGDVNRVRRGDRSWPAPGGDSGGGSTLRAVGASQGPDGRYYGGAGQNWTQVVVLREGAVESYSANPYGQSDHPDSPHYTDQAEKLFSKPALKPTWFQPDELEGHVESTTELEYP